MSTMSALETGEWLATSLAATESAMAEWLEALAEFDQARGWALDGQLSCVDWLMWRCRMSKSSAYEKVQTARQLAQRPLLREALRSGRVSYSVARLMARMDRADPAVDAAIIDAAGVGTVRDVERLVGAYLRHADQHRRPADIAAKRGVRVRSHYDGTATIEIRLEDLEVADFLAVLDAFMAVAAGADEPDGSAAESARAEDSRAEGAEPDPSWHSRRADAVMDMARTAIKYAGEGRADGDDRFMVHAVLLPDGMTLLDGTPLDEETATRLACDSAQTELLLGPRWEPLAMGRRTRDWTTAQRRALLLRDGGECRFPGCRNHRYVDAHHQVWWTHGGPTDVANGVILCSAHHRLVHHGWSVTGDANGELVFHRPDGSEVGSTRPRLRPRRDH